jgi:hypothetical protein
MDGGLHDGSAMHDCVRNGRPDSQHAFPGSVQVTTVRNCGPFIRFYHCEHQLKSIWGLLETGGGKRFWRGKSGIECGPARVAWHLGSLRTEPCGQNTRVGVDLIRNLVKSHFRDAK